MDKDKQETRRSMKKVPLTPAHLKQVVAGLGGAVGPSGNPLGMKGSTS